MLVELVYGYMSNSLGLISDAFHMLFDCMALLIGLVASYIAQLESLKKQSGFDYSKIEVVSGLINAVFLIFIALNIFGESVERVYQPVRIEGEGLLTVSILGFFVNLIGLFFFHDFHHPSHSHGEHHHHHHAQQDEDACHQLG
mmetsp:Transcript_4148/g.7021  ORF Transcript_4148/g.7021 Transcript_4148/m.7021 type:complete len:143 (+) Transcript_4148:1503-1931(+)